MPPLTIFAVQTPNVAPLMMPLGPHLLVNGCFLLRANNKYTPDQAALRPALSIL